MADPRPPASSQGNRIVEQGSAEGHLRSARAAAARARDLSRPRCRSPRRAGRPRRGRRASPAGEAPPRPRRRPSRCSPSATSGSIAAGACAAGSAGPRPARGGGEDVLADRQPRRETLDELVGGRHGSGKVDRTGMKRPLALGWCRLHRRGGLSPGGRSSACRRRAMRPECAARRRMIFRDPMPPAQIRAYRSALRHRPSRWPSTAAYRRPAERLETGRRPSCCAASACRPITPGATLRVLRRQWPPATSIASPGPGAPGRSSIVADEGIAACSTSSVRGQECST